MLRIPVVGPLALAAVCAATSSGQAPGGLSGRSGASAEIHDIRYDITFDHTTAPQRLMKVAATFIVAGTGPVLLSLPEWTPGAYEISNFARWAMDFSAVGDGRALS